MDEPVTITIETLEQRIEPVFESDYVPIGLFSSNGYAPFCGVLVESIVEKSKDTINYDIIILESEISDINKQHFMQLIENKDNFSIRFVNIKDLIGMLNITPHNHFTVHNVTKLFFMSPVFSSYSSIVCLDSDLVMMRDISDLYYSFDSNYAMTAVEDIQMKMLVKKKHKSSGEYAGEPAGDYIVKRLGMPDPWHYYNTGVCVFNLEKCRPLFKEMIDGVNAVNYWFLEQDIFNKHLGSLTKPLESRWNGMVTADRDGIKNYLGQEVYDRYLNEVNTAYIVHYPGHIKPWGDMSIPSAVIFMTYAQQTPWYSYIVTNLIKNMAISIDNNRKTIAYLRYLIDQQSSKKTAKGRKMLRLLLKLTPNNKKPDVEYKYGRFYDRGFWNARSDMIGRNKVLNKLGTIEGCLEYKNKEKLVSYKSKYEGKRCFIIGNGPSLTVNDLEKLGNEITFGMNSLYKVFDRTDWRPTFYVNNDIALNYNMKVSQQVRYQNYLDSLKCNNKSIFFTTTSIYNEQIIRAHPDHEILFLPVIDYMYQIRQPKMPQYGNNCSKKLYAFGTTAYLIFQLAVYMGFKEIIFIGMDCDYTSKPHFYDDPIDRELYSGESVKWLGDALELGFGAIAYYAKKKKITVYNATRGGRLNLFPRKELDKVI